MKSNEDRGNREKKEEKLDTSISNHEIGFINFHRFKAFTILIKKSTNLLHLRGSIYEAKLIMCRSSRPEVFCKIGVLRHFTKFTRKNLYQSIYLNKVGSLHPVAAAKKDNPAQVLLRTRFL